MKSHGQWSRWVLEPVEQRPWMAFFAWLRWEAQQWDCLSFWKLSTSHSTIMPLQQGTGKEGIISGPQGLMRNFHKTEVIIKTQWSGTIARENMISSPSGRGRGLKGTLRFVSKAKISSPHLCGPLTPSALSLHWCLLVYALQCCPRPGPSPEAIESDDSCCTTEYILTQASVKAILALKRRSTKPFTAKAKQVHKWINTQSAQHIHTYLLQKHAGPGPVPRPLTVLVNITHQLKTKGVLSLPPTSQTPGW